MHGKHEAAGPKGVAEFLASLVALALSALSGALIFAVAEDGISTFQQLAATVLLPAIGLLVLVVVIAFFVRWTWLWHTATMGVALGALSTVGLEVVRMIGFRAFHSMPGDLPTLMGVLLTGRIMAGPDTASTIAGYADHFWNGAMFGVLYVLVFGRQAPWIGMLYGALLGIGFLASPVPNAIGAGFFGVNVGPAFAITVILAHMLFGLLLGMLTRRSAWVGSSMFTVFRRAGTRSLTE